MLETKLETLTQAQIREMDLIAKKWIDVGTSTTKADRKKAEEAISKVYKSINLEKPKFIWFDSPFFCTLFIEEIKKISEISNGQLRPKVFTKVWGQVWEQVGSQTAEEVRDEVKFEVMDEVWTQVKSQIVNQVLAFFDNEKEQIRNQANSQTGKKVMGQALRQLFDKVAEKVWDEVSDHIRAQVWEQWNQGEISSNFCVDSFSGQHDVAWLAYYEFFQKAGLKFDNKTKEFVDIFSDIATSCNWWYPYKDFCVLSEKYSICSLQDGQLHSDNSPAIAFRDGFEIYAINGHRVTKQIVMSPETITIEQIENENNAEVRRIMIERLGTDIYLAKIGAEIIDIDSSNNFRALLRDKNGQKWLEGTDGSTTRIYFMPVPRHVKTCKEAHESICGISEDMILMQS